MSDETGRPPRWETVQEMQSAMNGYFKKWDSLTPDDPQYKKAPNIFGLCLHAKMSYDTFCGIENGEYDKRDTGFSKAVKEAKLWLLDFNSQHSLSHTAGCVFNTINLTRKMVEPWKNAQSNEVTGNNGSPLQIVISQNQAGIV